MSLPEKHAPVGSCAAVGYSALGPALLMLKYGHTPETIVHFLQWCLIECGFARKKNEFDDAYWDIILSLANLTINKETTSVKNKDGSSSHNEEVRATNVQALSNVANMLLKDDYTTSDKHKALHEVIGIFLQFVAQHNHKQYTDDACITTFLRKYLPSDAQCDVNCLTVINVEHKMEQNVDPRLHTSRWFLFPINWSKEMERVYVSEIEKAVDGLNLELQQRYSILTKNHLIKWRKREKMRLLREQRAFEREMREAEMQQMLSALPTPVPLPLSSSSSSSSSDEPDLEETHAESEFPSGLLDWADSILELDEAESKAVSLMPPSLPTSPFHSSSSSSTSTSSSSSSSSVNSFSPFPTFCMPSSPSFSADIDFPMIEENKTGVIQCSCEFVHAFFISYYKNQRSNIVGFPSMTGGIDYATSLVNSKATKSSSKTAYNNAPSGHSSGGNSSKSAPSGNSKSKVRHNNVPTRLSVSITSTERPERVVAVGKFYNLLDSADMLSSTVPLLQIGSVGKAAANSDAAVTASIASQISHSIVGCGTLISKEQEEFINNPDLAMGLGDASVYTYKMDLQSPSWPYESEHSICGSKSKSVLHVSIYCTDKTSPTMLRCVGSVQSTPFELRSTKQLRRALIKQSQKRAKDDCTEAGTTVASTAKRFKTEHEAVRTSQVSFGISGLKQAGR